MASIIDFSEGFQALTGHAPLKWQCRLFDKLAAGKIPGAVTLPTGLGKSSVIPIWLIALAAGGALPRRLLYVVNRRTVVDQATDEAKRLLSFVYQSGRIDNLKWAKADEHILQLGLARCQGNNGGNGSSPPTDTPIQFHEPLDNQHALAVATIRKALATISCDDSGAPLAVSTLRGELADNGEWKQNPARPAIIIGTIDMIGSKLLFSGYGDGRYGRAHHAGLIGQDALIVHDEAHLSPAFDALLTTVEDEQRRTKELRPIRVMRLSATIRANDDSHESNGSNLTIEADDHKDAIVSQRLNAKKALRFIDADNGKEVDAIVVEAARLGEHPNRVLVYVRSPDTASRVVVGLRKKIDNGSEGRVALLTGTLRGYERDQLAGSDLLKAFQAGSDRSTPLPHSLYLVSTSAGEVGADWDADHLVCDLTTLDSMAQRFGRVNRLGGKKRDSEIIVVAKQKQENDSETGRKVKAPSPLDAAIAKTGEILRNIEATGGDVCPAVLTKVINGLAVEDKQTAFSPKPTILPATDILFDHWSLTSITAPLPGRSEVAPYLHGVAAWEPPETYVAWRAEVSELAKAGVSDDDLEEILDAFPIRMVEKLRDRSDRVFDEMQAIAERLGNNPDSSNQGKDPAIILIKQATVQWTTLSKIAPADFDKKRIADSPLAHATIVLPVEVGGLKDGMLAGLAGPRDEPKALDVAETNPAGQRARRRVWILGDDSESPVVDDQATGLVPTKLRIKFRDVETDEAEGNEHAPPPRVAIEYRVEKAEAAEPGRRVALKAHNEAVAANAERIAKALAVPDELFQAFRLAGRMHDQGKDRDLWQCYARNLPHGQNPGGAIAKSNRYGGWQTLGGYRHEFGSMLDAATADEINEHPERDLILHLIAAHHGWGRPHFERRAFDNEKHTLAENEQATVEAVQRFARLQQRFGRWGLAWLESLLRSADASASSEINTGGAK